MADLTVIHITANLLPQKWADYQMNNTKHASAGYPLLTVSRKRGSDIYDTHTKSPENIYRQLLRAAKMATTPYIAVAEDDTLYTQEHFNFYRPPLDRFAYNQNRLALFTWDPMYSWRNRKSNCSLIAPRVLMIEALEERFTKYPDGIPEKYCGELGRKRVDKWLGVTVRKSIEVYSRLSIIQFNHIHGTEERQRLQRKAHGPIKALDIPHWGKAEELARLFV